MNIKQTCAPTTQNTVPREYTHTKASGQIILTRVPRPFILYLFLIFYEATDDNELTKKNITWLG